MSLVAIDVDVNSIAGNLLPLHGCSLSGTHGTHLLNVEETLGSAFEYVS